MKGVLKVAGVALLGLLSACAEPIPVDVDYYDVPQNDMMGGSIKSFAHAVTEANERGLKVRITHAECLSACTYWLLADDICVDAETKFGFHSAKSWVSLIVGLPVPDMRLTKIWAADLQQKYPGLGDWLLEYGVNYIGYTFKTGQQMHDEFGVPLCGDV